MSDGRIYGKVALVNSDREIVLNRGEEHGVTEGTKFVIQGPEIEVTDPDSGEVLGVTRRIHTIVKVDEVAEKMSIARTFRKKKVLVEKGHKGGMLANSLGYTDMFQPPKPDRYETQVETLRIDPKASGLPVDPDDSVVQVGDEVMQVLPDDNFTDATMTSYR